MPQVYALNTHSKGPGDSALCSEFHKYKLHVFQKGTPQFWASDCYPETVYTPKSLGFQDFLFSNQGLAKYSKDSLWAVLAGGSQEAANATQASEYTQGPKVPKF